MVDLPAGPMGLVCQLHVFNAAAWWAMAGRGGPGTTVVVCMAYVAKHTFVNVCIFLRSLECAPAAVALRLCEFATVSYFTAFGLAQVIIIVVNTDSCLQSPARLPSVLLPCLCEKCTS